MICEHPQCTGRHSASALSKERCPAFKVWISGYMSRYNRRPENIARRSEIFKKRYANDIEFRTKQRTWFQSKYDTDPVFRQGYIDRAVLRNKTAAGILSQIRTQSKRRLI